MESADFLAYQIAPFSYTGLRHREQPIDPDTIRQLRPNLYVLTNIELFNDPLILPHCKALLRDLNGLSDEEIAQSAFYVFFAHDEDCLEPLRRIIRCGGLFIPPIMAHKVAYRQTTARVSEAIKASKAIIGRLFGNLQEHENICQAIEMTRDVPGDYVEIGVFTGSSAFTAMHFMYLRGIQRRCWLLDTYEGFNYESAAGKADMIWHGTHLTQGPLDEHMQQLDIKLSMAGSPYHMVKNNICDDPLPEEIKQIAVVNLDVDLYDAILVGLNRTAPLVSKGGVIICEDATSTPALYGAYVAMHDFLETELGKKFTKLFMHGQYFLLKTVD